MDAAIEALRESKGLSGQDDILTPLSKQLTEAAMQAELEEHLASKQAPTAATVRPAKPRRRSPVSSS